MNVPESLGIRMKHSIAPLSVIVYRLNQVTVDYVGKCTSPPFEAFSLLLCLGVHFMWTSRIIMVPEI